MSDAARQLAIDFTRALTRRDYEAAYAMTTASYRQAVSQEQLREGLEAMLPDDWGETEPLEAVLTMQDWPDRQPDDVAWWYVSVFGQIYSEAVTVVVAKDDGELRIRTLELGRP